MIIVKLVDWDNTEYISCKRFLFRRAYENDNIITFEFYQEQGPPEIYFFGLESNGEYKYTLDIYVMNENGKTIDHLDLDKINNQLRRTN